MKYAVLIITILSLMCLVLVMLMPLNQYEWMLALDSTLLLPTDNASEDKQRLGLVLLLN